MGKVTIIVGGQWGDEGKGAIVDFLAEKADVVCRYAGGNNAGHTVVVGDRKYKFHLLPSGIIHKDKKNVLGNGMVVDPGVVVKEIAELEKKGFSIAPNNLSISSQAHVITADHIAEDEAKGKKIGTTGRGIGPCYRDKIARTGSRMGDYVLGEGEHAATLKPFVRDTAVLVNEVISAGKNVLIEGAQGTLLDIDHGTYPFVTSSNPTAGGACTGLGIGPTKVDAAIGIFKAYVTRVGEGPFPSEQGSYQEAKDEERGDSVTKDEIDKANAGDEYNAGKVLRRQGREYGTTTGRPRRCGWFDVVAAQYAIMVNGLTSVVITKLDVLNNFSKIKICVGYEVGGKKVDTFPSSLSELGNVKPVYVEMDGWNDDLTRVTSFKALPETAQKYLRRLEELIGVKISIVSVGPARAQKIVLDKGVLFC